MDNDYAARHCSLFEQGQCPIEDMPDLIATKNNEIERFVQLVKDLYPLAVVYAAQYASDIPEEVHPVHAKILARAKLVADKGEG